MKKKANFFAIGVFVIAAAVIASASVIVFGSGSLNKHTTTLLATFQGSANGLREGAQVKAYGIEIGSVTRIMLHQDPETAEILIPVVLEIDLTTVSSLLDDKAELDFTDENYREAIAQGMHVKLGMGSIVTGQLFVQLEYGLEGEGFVLEDERFSDFRPVPTVPTDTEILMGSLRDLVANLGQTDLAGLVEGAKGTMADLQVDLAEIDFKSISSNLNGLITSAEEKVSSPEAQKIMVEAGSFLESYREFGDILGTKGVTTLDELNASLAKSRDTLDKVEDAVDSLETWLDPSNTVYLGAVDAIDQISDAARALRILVDYVQRNPSAFITGKKTEEAPQ